MTTKTLPQLYCRDVADHPAHEWFGRRYNVKDQDVYRCPGRWTPSQHGGISGDPRPTEDPFDGIEE